MNKIMIEGNKPKACSVFSFLLVSTFFIAFFFILSSPLTSANFGIGGTTASIGTTGGGSTIIISTNMTSYNATYAALLNQQCPVGQVVNGTFTNGTFTCVTPSVSSSTYNATYAGLIGNVTYTTTYNETYAGLIDNTSYLTTYNATYNSLLDQNCPAGQIVNGTYANGTLVCTTVTSSSTYNASYNTHINNETLHNITGYVPYTGATKSIDIGKNNFTLNGSIEFKERGGIQDLFFVNPFDGDGFRMEYWYNFEQPNDDWLIFRKTDGNDDRPDGGIGFMMTNVTGYNWTILKLDGYNRANFTTMNIITTGNVTADWFNGKFNWTTNSSYLSFDGAVLGFVENSSWLSTYNETYHGLIGNVTYTTTFNSTYDTLLNQNCPAGQIVNGTYANGTFICTTAAASTSTYNATYDTHINNFTAHNLTNYIPYTGATNNINLGVYNLTTAGYIYGGDNYAGILGNDAGKYAGYFESYLNGTAVILASDNYSIESYGNSYFHGNLTVAGNVTAKAYFIGNGSQLTDLPFNSYNATYAGLIGNITYITTYNATYDILLNQNCPAGQVVNGTLVNGTFVCTTSAASSSTYNATYNTHINNLTEHNTTFWYNQSIYTPSDYNWSLHDDYPAVCGDGEFEVVIGLGDALNCAALPASAYSTYNSTYNTLLNQNCPAGQVVNGTLVNGTFVCTAAASSSSTYNATYAGLIDNVTYTTTYNATYNGLIGNVSYLTTYNETYAGVLDNVSYLTTYNSTYHGLIGNVTYLTTYNTTYANILSQTCNAGEVVNGTLSNGTFICTAVGASSSTYNATYAGLIGNVTYTTTYNETYNGLIDNVTYTTTYNATYANLLLSNTSILDWTNVTGKPTACSAGTWTTALPTTSATQLTCSKPDIANLAWANDWMIAYSNGAGLVELTFNDASGKYLRSNGESALTWDTPSTYNATYAGLIGNVSYLTTFNATYDILLNQNCPEGKVVNGTLVNGTFTCTAVTATSTYNATYAGVLDNVTYLTTYNWTYHGVLDNVTYLTTYNWTYHGLIGNTTYTTTYNDTYNGLIGNVSYLTTYNATYAGVLDNVTYLTTYNTTYANILSQYCPIGEIVNGTLVNGTFVCTHLVGPINFTGAVSIIGGNLNMSLNNITAVSWINPRGTMMSIGGNFNMTLNNITGINYLNPMGSMLRVGGLLNMSNQNITFDENASTCYGATCKGRIYYNGSSLVITVT